MVIKQHKTEHWLQVGMNNSGIQGLNYYTREDIIMNGYLDVVGFLPSDTKFVVFTEEMEALLQVIKVKSKGVFNLTIKIENLDKDTINLAEAIKKAFLNGKKYNNVSVEIFH